MCCSVSLPDPIGRVYFVVASPLPDGEVIQIRGISQICSASAPQTDRADRPFAFLQRPLFRRVSPMN
uniref:Uncharacterized protein n=1 Tax=Picea glauca TaxID=3330 RepID=A0A101M0A4_PICGL|nr:hypothetical protein ABT39_MTgene4572 [Picea glauca]